ncbi:polyprenyl synthetase family protein [Candidatus Omnitrophota bacterium]
MDITQYILDKKKLIDNALDRYLPSSKAKPQVIHNAMRYAVFPGGKRIRPVLTLASFEACGGRVSSILPVACAIELIHTYTLIHDDLPYMDNDDSRRGRPSCHKKFNEGLALLAGDALLTLSFELLSESGNVDIVKEISRAIGTGGTVGGQVVDILRHEREAKKEKSELDYIASHKTGALFETAVKAAGIFKGVSRKKRDELGNFGRCIGFTFQLIDDLIDGDGYVEIYGARYARKRAEVLTERAKGHLKIFEKKARRLKEIADLILERQA